MRTPLATLTLTLALSLPGLARADVYKCLDGKGGSVQQDRPCTGSPQPAPSRSTTDKANTTQADQQRWNAFLAQERAAKQAAALVEQKSAEQSRREALEMVLAGLKQIPRPADYQARIDAMLVRMLKDPDSRKVAFTVLPWGSLVCGTVNARNGFGGYTGAQPFVAYFDTQGGIGDFKVYPAKELKTALLIGEDLEQQLLRDCGYRYTP